MERKQEWFQPSKVRGGGGRQSVNLDGESADSADTESVRIETMVSLENVEPIMKKSSDGLFEMYKKRMREGLNSRLGNLKAEGW